MDNPQKATRSGASQASTADSSANGDDYSNARSGHHRSSGTPGGSSDSAEEANQSQTAGGTSSDQPRQIDQQ